MIKAIRTKVSTYAIALLISCGFTVPSMAGSSDFSGIYGAVWASAGGAQIDGSHTDRDGNVSQGQVGGVFPLGGYEIGFNLPLGDVLFLGAGHSVTSGGTAEIARGVGDAKGGSNSEGESAGESSFNVEATDLKSVYLMPSISIYDNSAVYVKVGRSIADLTATGGAIGAPNNLQGDLLGVGTIAMTPSGLFIKTEGSVTRFDDIFITGVANSASAKVEGTPDVVRGTVSIGFKF